MLKQFYDGFWGESFVMRRCQHNAVVISSEFRYDKNSFVLAYMCAASRYSLYNCKTGFEHKIKYLNNDCAIRIHIYDL